MRTPEHVGDVREQHGTWGTYYTAECSCGWERNGYEYGLSARRAVRTHIVSVAEATQPAKADR